VEKGKHKPPKISFKILLILAPSCTALSGRRFTFPSEMPLRTRSCVGCTAAADNRKRKETHPKRTPSLRRKTPDMVSLDGELFQIGGS
jgi:hypothetical protein